MKSVSGAAIAAAIAVVCLPVLVACSGGGGSGGVNTALNTTPASTGGSTPDNSSAGSTSSSASSGNTSGNTSSNPAPPATSSVSITAPSLGVGLFGGLGTNFTTNLPPHGTSLPLGGATVVITPTSVANFTAGPVNATFQGTVTSGGLTWPVFDLSIPSLSLTANNLRGDGTVLTLPDGGKVTAKFSGMTYTLLGAWEYVPASGNTDYVGHVVTGYSTAPGSVPTSGSATYTGTGGVVGAYAVPSGSNAIQFGTLVGNASLNVNFSTNAASGSFTNMQATAIGSSTPAPWNDISLSGNLSKTTGPGAAAFVDGSTTTPGNSGAAGFSIAAHGVFHGALYGPTGQEVGGTWTLSETGGGGKAAIGTFGAKQ
jgi:hypothetical protein